MLRPYQTKTTNDVENAFTEPGVTSVLATTATGGGKTRMTAYMSQRINDINLIQAHRQELVFQLCMALADYGIEHRILAPDAVINFIREKQIEAHNRTFIYGSAAATVASVDTLISRSEHLGQWAKQVKQVQTDEAHHALGALTGDPLNKWGKALRMFPKARFLGWTATAMRPDRKPLRSSFQRLVLGPTTRELLDLGFLCKYQIFGPPPSIDMAGALIGDSGDYSPAELARRAERSTIVGDMLTHDQKLAPGKVGIGFCINVDQAKEMAATFQSAGIPCEWMSSKETDDRKRVKTMEALRRGDIKLIFNVDLLGEGVDVPRVEVVLDGRPTMSLVRYLQAFGRLLRLFEGKTLGTYIDMVGNVMRHGLPDRDRDWTLDEPERRKRTMHDEDELTACSNCFKHYEAWRAKCPHCGHKPVVVPRPGRTGPDAVDGDLTEYTPELLADLMKRAGKLLGAAPAHANGFATKGWNERAVALQQLVDAINWWMSFQVQTRGVETASAYRLFWHRFGIDVATAQTLSGPQAVALRDKLWEDINNESSRPTQPVRSIVPVDDVLKRDVSKYIKGGSFNAAVTHNNNKVYLGRYPTPELARAAEDEYRNKHDLKKQATAVKGGSYDAMISHNNKRIYLGRYPTPELARAAEDEYRNKHGLRKPSTAIKGGGYRAYLRHKGKQIYLGRHSTPELAQAAEDEYRSKHNLPKKAKTNA